MSTYVFSVSCCQTDPPQCPLLGAYGFSGSHGTLLDRELLHCNMSEMHACKQRRSSFRGLRRAVSVKSLVVCSVCWMSGNDVFYNHAEPMVSWLSTNVGPRDRFTLIDTQTFCVFQDIASFQLGLQTIYRKILKCVLLFQESVSVTQFYIFSIIT